MKEDKFFKILGTTKEELNCILFEIDTFYTEWKRDKLDNKTGTPRKDKDGNILYRKIYPSSGRLKEIQRSLRTKILNKITYPDYIQGGVKGKSFATNARLHKGKKYKFCTDLKQFFPSVTNKLVFKALKMQGFNTTIASYITKLTTYKGFIPQGTSTADALANLVFYHLKDKEIYQLCQTHNITYSRYIDDLIFSSSTCFKPVTLIIVNIIKQDDIFRINHRKTTYTSSPVEITGVLTKNNLIDVPSIWHLKIEDPSRSEKSIEGLKNNRKYIRRISKQRGNLN